MVIWAIIASPPLALCDLFPSSQYSARRGGGNCAAVDIAVEPFEERKRRRRLAEAAAVIKAVRIPRAQDPAPESPELGIGEDGLDEPASEPPPPLRFVHEHVRQIGEGGVVRYHPGKPHLAAVAIKAIGA